VFREMLTFTPAMQLTYDCFGPMYHLGQDKWTRKYQASDPHSQNELPTQGIGWHSDGPHGFPEIAGHVPFHTLRFGYFMSDTTHEGQNGTLECMAGSHRSLLATHAQINTVYSGAGREAQWPISLNPRNGPPEQDQGEDPSTYSDNHMVHKAPAGTIVAFQNGCERSHHPSVHPPSTLSTLSTLSIRNQLLTQRLSLFSHLRLWDVVVSATACGTARCLTSPTSPAR
jgi:hypothetical protein